MKFVTHNDKEMSINGTCLQGEIKANYADLVKKFGKPIGGDAYKVDASWVIKFENGDVATIYNWKDGKNYNGESGVATESITEWHVGGHKKSVVGMVEEVLKEEVEKEFTVINDEDGNDSFTVKAKDANDAAFKALEALGYWISKGEEVEDDDN